MTEIASSAPAETTTVTLDGLAQEAATRFLKSVIVIDDQMTMTEAPDSDLHSLDASCLARAFAEKKIACAVYRPGNSDGDRLNDLVALIRQNDAAIVDWQLSDGNIPLEARTPGGGGSEVADNTIAAIGNTDKTLFTKNIIKEVLSLDLREGNPPRVIIIYTAERIDNSIVNDLKDHLSALFEKHVPGEGGVQKREDGDVGAIQVEGNTISHGNFMVAFYKKERRAKKVARFGADTSYSLECDKLPAKLVKHYAEISNGLLPSAMLHALATLRDNVGRLLATFNGRLDSALAAHAMLIPEVGDVERFLTKIIADEVNSTLEECGYLPLCVSIDAFRAWAEAKTPPEASNRSQKVGAFFECVANAKNKPDRVADVLGSIIPGVDHVKIFHDFGRLSMMSKEAFSLSRGHRSDAWKPRITQGTVISCDDEAAGCVFYLCVISRCDSNGIGMGGLAFPFIRLERCASARKAGISILAGDSLVHFKRPDGVNWKKIEYITFPAGRRVEATLKTDAAGKVRFVFEDVRGVSYGWLCEMKDYYSNSIISTLVGGLARIGIDEFDWLRRNK